MKNIINCLSIFIIFTIPYKVIAALNISFISTESGSSVVTAEETTTGTLRLQKKTLTNGSYVNGDHLDIVESNNSLGKVLLIPVSLSNNQITDRLIVIHTNNTGNVRFSAYITNIDFSNSFTANRRTIASGSNQSIETSPIVMNNSDGMFLILGLKGTSNDVLRYTNLIQITLHHRLVLINHIQIYKAS